MSGSAPETATQAAASPDTVMVDVRSKAEVWGLAAQFSTPAGIYEAAKKVR